MRIGLLTTSFPSREDETSGAFVAGFAQSLVDAGHTVHVLAPMPRVHVASPQTNGVDVTFVEYAPRGLRETFHGAGVLDNVRATARAWPGLVTFPLALLAHASRAVTGWDAIVSHFALPCAVVAAMVRGARPHLAVMHSADLHLLDKLPMRRGIARRIEEGSTALWFVSNVGRDTFTSALGHVSARPTHVAPMGVTAPPRAQATRNTRTRVLFLGRLVPVKGVDVLLEALHGLDDVDLDVVGDGPLRPALMARAHALGLRARFHGAITGDAKWRFFAEADLVVLPSRVLESGRTEGAPVVAVEAMAAGTPLIATRVGGVPALVGDAACLVASDDVHALRTAIVALGADQEMRAVLARRGIERARAFSWHSVGERALALLDDRVAAPTR